MGREPGKRAERGAASSYALHHALHRSRHSYVALRPSAPAPTDHAAAKSSVASCPAERIFVCPLDKPHLPRTSNANRIKSAVRGMPSFPLMTVHELAMVL
jgi:hypothetical protein